MHAMEIRQADAFVRGRLLPITHHVPQGGFLPDLGLLVGVLKLLKGGGAGQAAFYS